MAGRRGGPKPPPCGSELHVHQVSNLAAVCVPILRDAPKGLEREARCEGSPGNLLVNNRHVCVRRLINQLFFLDMDRLVR